MHLLSRVKCIALRQPLTGKEAKCFTELWLTANNKYIG